MSSPVPPPPSGGQPSYVPPSEGQQNPYAPEAGYPAEQGYGQPAAYGQAPYGQAPYEQQAPGQPYAQQYPGQPFPGGPRATSGLAVAALVVGIISFILAWIPFVNVVAILGGIAALILGIMALRKVKRGVAGGKGMAIAGTVLGGISLVLSILITVVLGVAIDEAVNNAGGSAPVVGPAQPDDTEETVDVEEPVDAEEPAAAGDVLALGSAAEVGDYTVTVTGLNLNANEALAAANDFNEPPSGQYVMADVSVVYTGTEEGNPWLDLSYVFQGSDSRQYDDSTCMAVEPNSVIDVPTLVAGGAADYQVCLDMPAEAIEGGSFFIQPLISFDETDRATWAIR